MYANMAHTMVITGDLNGYLSTIMFSKQKLTDGYFGRNNDQSLHYALPEAHML